MGQIREQILAGQLNPGDRIAGRSELQLEYGVSRMTVQRAFDRLIADGFVVTRGRHGTFVADVLPHHTRYVLAFPAAVESTNRFWKVLAAEAAGVLGRAEDVECYYEVDRHIKTGDFPLLCEDVAEHRIAGIFFSTQARLLEDTPILEDRSIPKVSIQSNMEVQRHWPFINLSHGFLERAIAYLDEERGFRDIALISPVGATNHRNFPKLMKARKLNYAPWWEQAVDSHALEWVENLTMAMLRGKPSERPQALIIGDDNLIEFACKGIARLGLTSDDICVVTHCNFPETLPVDFEVVRLGYDTREVLRTGFDLLRAQREGRPVEREYRIMPKFSWEL